MKKELAIIIPVYNEEDSISQVIDEWAPKGDLILINDGSHDRSREIIEGHSTSVILINQKNQGHAQSCINGYNYALDNGYQWIFQTDSDGQTKPSEFDTIWQRREDHQVLFGKRVNRQDGFHRKIISLILRMVMCLLLGKYLKDPNVPFRLMNAENLRKALANLPNNLFLANAYLTLELAKITTIFWHPISFAPRDGGVASVNFLGFFKVGFRVFKEFLSVQKKSKFSLEIVTLWYLTLPLLLFFVGWLHLWFSLPLVLLTLYLLYKHHKKINWSLNPMLVGSFLLIFLWVYYAGAGGFTYQNGDYQKHNAMLFDLIAQAWPVTYESPYQLVYYFGHYLVPALFGKIFGTEMAHTVFFLWTFLGAWLSLLWFFRFIGKKSFVFALFFILFSGMDIIGQLIIDSKLLSGATAHIEWWVGYKYWQYSANSSLLCWVPQHAIAGWLLVSLLLSTKVPRLFVFALSSLWSPFIMLGLIPFLAIKVNYRKIVNWENAVGLIILLVMGLFYKSGGMTHRSYFLWTKNSIENWLPSIALFYALEFGLIALLIAKKAILDDKKLFLTALLTLLLIPFYIFGHYNDFGMRSSIPALFVFQIFVARYILQNRGRIAKIVLILLLIGAATPFLELNRSIQYSPRGFSKYRTVPHVQDFVAAQYMGRSNSIFFKYLARKAEGNILIPRKVKRWL